MENDRSRRRQAMGGRDLVRVSMLCSNGHQLKEESAKEKN
jgi:hypothetical protein